MVRDGNGWRVVVDGKIGRKYESVNNAPFGFSPNSRRFGYRATIIEKNQVAVVDETASKPYEVVVGPVFSPDSKHVAYLAKTGSKTVLVIDDKEEELPYEPIGFSGFTPDSQGIAYAATKNGKQFWMVKGKEQGSHDYIGELAFNSDGSRIAYVAGEGKPLPSPNRWYNPFAGAWRTAKLPKNEYTKLIQFAVVDGQEGKRYNMVDGFVFSPDGRHVAYRAMAGNKWFAVLDGQEQSPALDWLSDWPIVFSSDSNRIAYSGGRGKRSCVVIDGKVDEWDDVAMNPVFSPDGKRVAYAARDGAQYFAIVDGKQGKRYDAHRPPGAPPTTDLPSIVFSPDSRYVAYCGHDKRGYFVVVDGVEGKPGLWFAGQIVFDSSERLHYLQLRATKKSTEFYLVEERVPQGGAKVSEPLLATVLTAGANAPAVIGGQTQLVRRPPFACGGRRGRTIRDRRFPSCLL